jgi:hypothetical protein
MDMMWDAAKLLGGGLMGTGALSLTIATHYFPNEPLAWGAPAVGFLAGVSLVWGVYRMLAKSNYWPGVIAAQVVDVCRRIDEAWAAVAPKSNPPQNADVAPRTNERESRVDSSSGQVSSKMGTKP